jgi:beta-galactosidase
VHLVPSSWNWPGKEGQPIRVLAFSNAKRVELFLNGKSLGALDVLHDAHVEWQVPYAPGELFAKAINDGKVVATDSQQTTGLPARIILHADRTTLRAGAEDAVVAQVSIVDEKGRIVPNSDKLITFKLGGGGEILGVGNGNPADHDTDKADHRNTFHGRCIAVIEAGSQSGDIELTASSAGLMSDQVKFKVR